MKAKIDFGYIDKEEREGLKNFLSVLFSSEVLLFNDEKKYNQSMAQMCFCFNGKYFAIIFEDKIKLEDELCICNSLIKLNKQGVTVKKAAGFINVFPIIQVSFSFGGRKAYIATTQKIDFFKKDLFDEEIEKNKIIIKKNISLKIKKYKKESKNIYKIEKIDDVVIDVDCLEKKYFFYLNIDNQKINLIMSDIKENNIMDTEKTTKEDVKGEILIGTIDLDLSSLLSIQKGDKIILNRDEKIEGVLRLEGKNILKGDLSFNDEEIIFTVESSKIIA